MKKKYPVPHVICSTPVNRADLLRCYTILGEENPDIIESLTGFRKIDKEEVPEKEHTGLSDITVDTEKHAGEVPGETYKRIQFFRVTGYRKKEDEETESSAPRWYKDARTLTVDELRSDPKAVPAAGPPLASWSRIWPFLRQAMGTPRESRDPDVAEVVKRIASCIPLKRLPFLKRKTWGTHCQVLFDFSRHLILYRNDLIFLYQGIQRLRGLTGLQALLLTASPTGPVRTLGKWKEPFRSYHRPPPGTPVFIISDLGCLDPEKKQVHAWISFGRGLKKAGFLPVVLTPCPVRLLDPGLIPLYRIAPWDRGKKITAVRRYLSVPGKKKKQPVKSPGVEKLLAMISVAVRVEPPLLRSLRYLLPQKEADAGTEAEVWHHEYTNTSSQGISLIEEVREQYRALFKTGEYRHLYKDVEGLLRKFHSHLSPAVREEEVMLTALVTGSGEMKWKRFINNCVKTFDYKGFHYHEGLKAWWKRVFSRLPDDVWKDNDQLCAVWVMVYKEEINKNQITSLPPGLDLNKYQWILKSTRECRDILFREQEDHILITVREKPARDHAAAILSTPLSSPLLRICHFTGKQERSFTINLQHNIPAPIEKKETKAVVLDTTAWETAIEPFHRPPWAAVTGRDEYGLFCDCRIRGVVFRMRWIHPGEFLMGSPENEPGRNDDEHQHKVIITQGYWIGETACTQELWTAVMGTNPSAFTQDILNPVDSVSRDDCMDFLNKINALFPGLHLCLPTEAEWEHACRAGTQTPFYCGDTITPGQANFKTSVFSLDFIRTSFEYKNVKKTLPVKTFPCNSWGLYEMHGNLWEWCADWHAVYTSEKETDPSGPQTGEARVLRGGGWADFRQNIRSASRAFKTGTKRTRYTGFRFARKIEKKTEYITVTVKTHPAGICPPWAFEAGEDEYGEFVVCKVKDTAFRMRWINPGEFMMGSPENEPERYDDEILHKVILTKGYWLAETACTQELWEAVMGSNPSGFKGKQLPVETVSWEDCKEFILKLNKLVPGLKIRFPTEAEWEYACRAGTTTPFHFGDKITTDQVNYNGNFPYNNGKIGQYREKTVEVYALPCNMWGLYQMHGNVWEWCEDWYGDYITKTAIDPQGPAEGVDRVLRGGGWFGIAWFTRSACRYRFGPSNRSVNAGLRLARGH